MPKKIENDISEQIVAKAKKFGASLAGVANVEELKKSPSHVIYEKLDYVENVGTKDRGGMGRVKIEWLENAKSAIIIAVEHPENKPELDWWRDGYRGGTEGNRILISINARLSEWLEESKGIKTTKLLYHIEHGAIFFKDTAVMAGLGCIGKNNILITPEYGPRVRLRVMLTDELLPATGPVDFDPCQDCDMPCRAACPRNAFETRIYSREQYGLDKLPARTGVYARQVCNIQMDADVGDCDKIKVEGQDEPGKLVRYCRRCELACPVGGK